MERLCESRGGTASEAGYTSVNGGGVKENFGRLRVLSGFLPENIGTKVHVLGHPLCLARVAATTGGGIDADKYKSRLICN